MFRIRCGKPTTFRGIPDLTTILLARHGSHDEVGRVLSGRSAIALNAVGRAEAAALGERIATRRVDAIVSSPRPRAWETASIVAGRLRLTVEVADALDEIDFGEWTGHAFAELDGDPAWTRWNDARGSAGVPGGETQAAATARAADYLWSLRERGGTVLCVSHCDVIRGVAAHFLGLDADRILAFDCDPCSLTELSLWADGARVVSLNERVR